MKDYLESFQKDVSCDSPRRREEQTASVVRRLSTYRNEWKMHAKRLLIPMISFDNEHEAFADR